MAESEYLGQKLDEIFSDRQLDPEIRASMAAAIATTVGEVEQCVKIVESPSEELFQRNPLKRLERLPENPIVACPGVAGGYSHIASETIFHNPNLQFLQLFDDVMEAVAQGKADFGVLPVENSSAGDVQDVIEMVRQSGCYIITTLSLKVSHCLCSVKGGSKEKICTVLSHPQALMQSAKYIKNHGFVPIRETNTALAAKIVAESGDPSAGCICSRLSAEIYGLDVLEENIQDQQENYTKFIAVAKEAYLLPYADTISIAVSFPNQPGSLNKFLTRFSIFDLDLCKIQSMPIGGKDFNVRFHLDFKGDVLDENANSLLGHMYDVYDDFQFLGNFGQKPDEPQGKPED